MPERLPRREDAPRLLILAVVWTGLFLYVDPRGQFPLNDDFQYAECARRFLAGEGLHLPQWALSSTISHAVLGAVMTSPWGAANQALRLWMIVLGAAGAAAVYALARRWRASPDAALLAAATLAVSPLYAAMSASFHVDVTCVVFTLGALAAFLEGRETGRAGWLAVSSALIAGAGLARQTGFLCAAGGAAALALERRLSPRAAAALILPAGLAAAGFEFWFRFVHGPTWAWTSGVYTPKTSFPYWERPDVWSAVLERASDSIQTAALCLSPLALPGLRRALSRRPSRVEAAVLTLVVGAALPRWWSSEGLPLIENTLSRAGLGVVTLNGSEAKAAGWWASPFLWHAAALVAILSSAALVRAAAEELRGPRAAELRAAALFVAAPFVPALFLPAFYDRYLLMLLPAAAAAFAAGRADRGKTLAPAFAAAAALGLFTAAGLSDYFGWNRARWAAGQEALAHGVPPERVENGFDWDGQFTLTRNLAALEADKPAREIGLWEWQALNRPVVATSFAKTPPVPGWKPLDRFPYRTPLVPGGGEVLLYGAPAATKSR